MRGRGAVVVGLVAALLTSVMAGSTTAVIAAPADRVEVAVDEVLGASARPVNLLGFACSSATRCVVATDPPALTEDGGVTWRTLPGPRFNGVACASEVNCLAIDNFGRSLSSTDGGVTWAARGSMPGFTVRAIACPSVQRCVAVGARQVGSDLSASIAVTDDGGASWTFRYSLPDGSGFGQVQCASTSFCIASAFGAVVASTDGGSTWASLPTGLGTPLTHVTVGCASPTICFAIANTNILRSSDGGASWSAGASPLGLDHPSAIACQSVTHCVAAGGVFSATVQTFDPAGGSAADATLPGGVGPIEHVQCLATNCFIFGSSAFTDGGFPFRHALRSTDGGATWTRLPTPPPVSQVRALACADATVCVAVGDVDEPGAALAPSVRLSTDSGTTWVSGGTPATLGRLGVVECVPGGACVTAGPLRSNSSLAGIAQTVDGGATWSAATVDVTLTSVLSLSCHLGGICLASAVRSTPGLFDTESVVLRSTDSGASWQVAASFDPFISYGRLSCQSAERCMIIQSSRTPGAPPSLQRSLDGGSTWTVVPFAESVVGSASLAGCTAARCFLIQTGAANVPRWFRSEDLGLTWTPVSPAPPAGDVGALGCAGATCIVSAPSSVYASTDGGVTWGSTIPVISAVGDVTSTTCLSPTRCIGVTQESSLGGPGIVALLLTITPAPTPSTVAVAPARLLETRTGVELTTVDDLHRGVGRISAGSEYVLPVRGRGTVPDTAGSAVLNVVAVGAGSDGFLTVYPCDQPRPLASSLNYVAGATVANAVVAKLSSAGTTCVYSSADTDLVVDVGGYVTNAARALTGLTPTRLLDTRAGPGLRTVDRQHEGVGAIAAGVTYTLPVAGRGDVAADARTVVVNVAAVGAGAPGFLTVYPCETTRPNASTLNYGAGGTVANAVVAKLSATGTLCIFSSAATHVIVDVNAFLPDGGSSPVGLTPARLWETRSGLGLLTIDGAHQATGRRPAATTYELPVRNRGGVGPAATGAVVNVAAVGTGAPGFLTVYPCDTDRPNASSLNFDAGATVANLVFAKLSAAGTVCVFTSAPADVVLDVVADI